LQLSDDFPAVAEALQELNLSHLSILATVLTIFAVLFALSALLFFLTFDLSQVKKQAQNLVLLPDVYQYSLLIDWFNSLL
jgi:hypothetical protein